MNYALVYVTLRNYRTHEHLDMKFNGKSYVLVGDTEKGKSSILEALKVAHKYVPFPKDALKEGAKDGSLEIGIMIEGEPYRVSCDFDEDGRGRWRVRSEGKGSFSLEEVLRKLFVGLATKGLNSAYFDYSQYFFETKSPAARFEYLMSCLLGEVYDQNKKTIERLEKERGSFGSKRIFLQARVQAAGITDENFEALCAEYKEEKTLKKAEADKAKAIKKVQPTEDLEELLQLERDQNEAARQRTVRLKDLKDRETELARQLQLLNEQMATVEGEIDFLQSQQEQFPEDLENEKELARQLQELEEANDQIQTEAEQQYSAAVTEIQAFNVKRQAFLSQKLDYEQFRDFDKHWKLHNQQIKDVRIANIEAIKKHINVPGLEIRDIEKEVKGEVVVEQHVYYDGRELNADNVSKGASIRIATHIQKAINPTGFPLILLPEAQSLGGALPEIITEAHAQGYQVIAEFTEPHRDLEAVIVEDFIEQKKEEEAVIAQLRAKKSVAATNGKAAAGKEKGVNTKKKGAGK